MAERHPDAGTRYGAIDIGSNTVKLVIAETMPDGTLRPVFDGGVTTRIGEGIASRRLGEAPMQRTLDALSHCLRACVDHQCAEVYAVGTSALRDATNREDFLTRARSLGLTVAVLSGDEEARLSGLAVRSDPRWRASERLVVLDIGGGSTEVVFDPVSHAGPSHVSFQIGAVRLTERHLRSDPCTAQELAAAQAEASHTLGALHLERSDPLPTVVGVGGTVINMAAVAHRPDELDQIHGTDLTREEVHRQVELYAGQTIAQRKTIPRLDPARADVILGGAVILEAAMSALGADRIGVSCRGLRWGVLYDKLGGR